MTASNMTTFSCRYNNFVNHAQQQKLQPFTPFRSSKLIQHAHSAQHNMQIASRSQKITTHAGKGEIKSDPTSNLQDKQAGRSTYRPNSYTEIVNDAIQSVILAMNDGLTRMEVEFPALSNVDGYKGSSDLYIDANIQLALAAAKQLHATTSKKIHLLLPDDTEYRRAYKLFKSTLDLSDGLSLGHLQEGKQSFLSGFSSLLSSSVDIPEPSTFSSSAEIFIVLNASTVELPDVETYAESIVGNRPLISWNMELDTLRADLGLLGFPPKDLQYRFLSMFKPVFYIRQRDYSKTVAVAPFIINYSGALFREYPGPWQVMLRQDNGVYACVAEDVSRRYGLGEFKAELTRAMGLDTEAEGSTMAFLRSGYKTSTWWEDDEDKEGSKNWRS